MSKLSKAIGAMTVLLSMTVVGVGTTNMTASASTWHKGMPKAITNHSMWVDHHRPYTSAKHRYYTRSYMFTNKTSVSYDRELYYKDGKVYPTDTFFNGTTYINVPSPTYQAMGKKTYQIKSTLKRSGYGDQRFKIKQSGKKITVWSKRLWNHIDPNEGTNRSQKKWHKLGVYSPLKGATSKSIEKRDPLYK